MHPWKVAPGNDKRTNESIAENFSLDNHHSENMGKGIPPENSKALNKIKYTQKKNSYTGKIEKLNMVKWGPSHWKVNSYDLVHQYNTVKREMKGKEKEQ